MNTAIIFTEFDSPCLLFTDTRVHHFTRRAGVAAGHRLSQHHALGVSLRSAVPPLHCLLPHPQSKTPPPSPYIHAIPSPLSFLFRHALRILHGWILISCHLIGCLTHCFAFQTAVTLLIGPCEKRGGNSSLAEFQVRSI